MIHIFDIEPHKIVIMEDLQEKKEKNHLLSVKLLQRKKM